MKSLDGRDERNRIDRR